MNDRILREICESQTSVISVPDLPLAEHAIYRARVLKTHKGRHKGNLILHSYSKTDDRAPCGCSVALLSCVADVSYTIRLIICVFGDYFTRGRDGILHMKARSLSNQCDFCSENVLSDLSARSTTHLQLLPLKHKIVGIRSYVKCNVLYNVVYNCSNGVSNKWLKFTN